MSPASPTASPTDLEGLAERSGRVVAFERDALPARSTDRLPVNANANAGSDARLTLRRRRNLGHPFELEVWVTRTMTVP